MKSELSTRPHFDRQKESRYRDYLLTTRVGGVSRKIIWNDRSPMVLDHPKGWVISKSDTGVCIYDESNPDSKMSAENAIFIDQEDAKNAYIELQPAYNSKRSISLSIDLLTPLQPPYKETTPESQPHAHVPRQLLMYHGVRYFLMKYRPVGSKLTARAGHDQVFTYKKVQAGYSITPLTRDLIVKTKGQKLTLPISQAYLMNDAEFFSAAFIYGIYWWRFRSVVSPDSLPPLEEDESEEIARENRRFQIISQVMLSGFFLVFLVSLAYNHFFPAKPAAVITKIELKAPKVIPHAELAEAKPTPAPTPVPTPEPKKEVAKKEPPKKEPKKKIAKEKKRETLPQKVAKRETPKKIAKKEPAPPPPAAPPAKKIKDVPPAPVVAKKVEAPPPPDESAQVLKSLSFLSSGAKNPKQGNLAKYDKNAKKDFMNAPTLGGGSKSNVLDKMSNENGDTNIKTKSARSIASDPGFDAPKGKGLNDVKGKVSLTELYSGGASGGFEEGSSLAISGPGELSESEIEKALAKFISRFQFCYEKSLLTDSTLAGNIRMQWTITEKGKASDAKVLNSQMKNAALQACILKVLKDIPFPTPKGGIVTAKKTFSFKSSAL